MKLYSWNVNGIRAAEKKGFLDWLDETQPDVVCLQETKARVDQLERMGTTMGAVVRTDLKVAHMPIVRVLPKPMKP